ncbi:hypothetical protein dsat_0338 [Alkalidesulfovibrio alkalitolerans DSM 16529]|jgi:hypothetical protein|uniref:PBS lyase HEAT domain protein repeat-containing protein n=1 Tax=Alkalidesulfovibrio alkalitolerans DSM 16529 TaxID=1121439 RepID=S7T715_9BACT|nr:DVU0298 family protein [Alkalidesulfovibrio alkalitolerans]EPR32897.1 hypothetical protein dsat_0338 [Alkalidesulfovibrio alkalitolerans DSM 16529]
MAAPRLRRARERLREILVNDGWRRNLDEVFAWPAKTATGALHSFLVGGDALLRFRAAETFGLVTAALAQEKMEAARVVMRGLLWRMNEESGGIGWGAPEAMACCMAAHEGLAREYHAILLSYIHEHEGICHGIFVDNPLLRHGVLWGIARLAETRPDLVAKAVPDLLTVLDPARALEGREGTPEAPVCHDAAARGLVCLALSRLGVAGVRLPKRAVDAVAGIGNESGQVLVYRDDCLEQATVAALAREALNALERAPRTDEA